MQTHRCSSRPIIARSETKGRLLHHCANMRGGAEAKAFKVVATFQNGNDTPARVIARDLFDEACQVHEVLVGELEISKRITRTRIKARRNKNELGLKLLGCFQ